jgi:hypothetical protein
MGARLILLGGAPLEGPRYIWWNFVASNRETQRRNGARPTGAVACSIFRSEIATISFRCRPKIDPFDENDSVDAVAGV